MSQEFMSHKSNVLLGFIAGLATGALVLALTTPKSGAETREDLKALGRRLKGKVGALGEEAEDAWEEAKAGAGQVAKDVKRDLQNQV